MVGEPQPNPQQKKTKGTTIYVPAELKEKIKALSEKTGKVQWKVLLDALALYETTVRQPRVKEELPVIDKAVWYMQKLAMSIGSLKENPSEENLNKTVKTIQQVRDRLGVDTSLLERAATDYVRLAGSAPQDPVSRHRFLDEATMEINMALKSVLLEIVYTHILKEEEASQSGSQASEA
jgi:hypothetical protein